MLRNKPKLNYNGITLVLSNPSRFDSANTVRKDSDFLMTATGGQVMNSFCLQPEYNSMQCDIRVMEDSSPWLTNTRVIVLLGEAAMHHFTGKVTGSNTLNEMRGSPLYVDGIPAIASYFPQDAADHKGHEQALNQESKDYTGDDGGKEDDDEGDVKRFSPTKRANYAFWLRADMKKVKNLLKLGTGKWPVEQEPQYKIYPPAAEVIQVLTETEGKYMDFDIETNYENADLLCFSFCFDDGLVFSVPILTHNYEWAYPEVHLIMRALAIAVSRNILVAHNGHSFDFFVLAYKYHIPIVKAWDTMLAIHRCYPDIEKSLGHGTSLWTHQVFHKDSDSRAYFTCEHMMQKLKYCAKDVFTMRLIRKNIQKYAKTIPGLEDSIQCAQDSIRPYLTTTLLGIPYSETKRKEIMASNDRLMEQYLRCINLLIGEEGMELVRKSVAKAKGGFPSSNPQCVEYFHNILGYPVVGRNPPDQNGKRSPSLGKLAMYKLAMKHDNPVIRFVLMYRTLKTESGYLKFMPWKDDKNKIINRDTYDEQQALLRL